MNLQLDIATLLNLGGVIGLCTAIDRLEECDDSAQVVRSRKVRLRPHHELCERK